MRKIRDLIRPSGISIRGVGLTVASAATCVALLLLSGALSPTAGARVGRGFIFFGAICCLGLIVLAAHGRHTIGAVCHSRAELVLGDVMLALLAILVVDLITGLSKTALVPELRTAVYDIAVGVSVALAIGLGTISVRRGVPR